MLVILDLDETLIHATKHPIAFSEVKPDLEVFGYSVYLRPYLVSFLTQLSAYFPLAIWSSASDEYVKVLASPNRSSRSTLTVCLGKEQVYPAPGL